MVIRRHAHSAGQLLASVFGDQMQAGMNGGHFTCGEAENIAAALLLLNQADAARTWLAGHAMGDDDPDDQHTLQNEGDSDEAERLAALRIAELGAELGLTGYAPSTAWVHVDGTRCADPGPSPASHSYICMGHDRRIKEGE